MTETERFLITLASGIELFRVRSGGASEKRSALKSLTDLSSRDLFKFHVAGDRLRAHGKAVHVDLPGVHVILKRCELHGIAEVRVSRHAAEADLLLLLQTLAASPAEYAPFPDGGTVSVVDRDSVLAPVEISAEELVTAAAKRSPDFATNVDQLIEQLEHDPYPSDLLHQLNVIVGSITMELDHHHTEQAVDLIQRLMVLEQKAPAGSPHHNYALAFRRLFNQRNLARVAEAVDDARCTVSAAEIIIRAGLAGAGAIIGRLQRSRDVAQCTRYVQVLSEMPESARALVPLVDADEWTTACGAVELLGEFNYVKGVGALSCALEHADIRVRRAAAAALTRIGTHDAVAHVQRALGSDDDGMRSAVAGNVEGRKSGALAMPFLTVAEAESSRPEVVRDCFLALGRIGTPVAVQALLEATKPGGRIFRRKALDERLAAVEGLKLVPLPIARQRMAELMDDRDAAIRLAASDALSEIRETASV